HCAPSAITTIPIRITSPASAPWLRRSCGQTSLHSEREWLLAAGGASARAPTACGVHASAAMALLGVPHAWINPRIHHVDDQVDRDEDRREYQHGAHDDRIVT